MNLLPETGRHASAFRTAGLDRGQASALIGVLSTPASEAATPTSRRVCSCVNRPGREPRSATLRSLHSLAGASKLFGSCGARPRQL